MKNVFGIFGHIVFAVAAITGFGVVVMLLWNALVPNIFGLASIDFWQGMGLFVLCRLFFGGFGFRHFHGDKRKAKHFNHFHEKWMEMTPEERKEFVKKRHFHNFGHDFFNIQTTENQKYSDEDGQK